MALWADLVIVAAFVCPLEAQKPERRQDVRVPGIDLALKAGWRLVLHDGCRFAVPGSWRSTADGSAVVAADGTNLSVRLFKISSWSTHKAHIRAAYGHLTTLHEDSDRRLWFEIGVKPQVQHMVDVVNGLSTCMGLLEIRTATSLSPDDVTRIVESIGPARQPILPER
jgi:hypothetical protein